jgi:methionyl-tRNA formyltransferase
MRLILDHVSVAPDADYTGQPGEVLLAGKLRLLVATGDGLLSLDRVQPAGKRAMAIDEFLRGHPVAAGDRFSQ